MPSLCWFCHEEVHVKIKHGRIQRKGDGQGVLPLKIYKNIGFISNTDPDPLKNHKATKSTFNVGPSSTRQGNAIEMAFCWRADDGTLIVLFGTPLPSSKKKINTTTTTKNVVKFLIHSDKTYWIRACSNCASLLIFLQ